MASSNVAKLILQLWKVITMRQTQIYDLDMVWNLAKWPVFSAWCEVRLENSLDYQVEFNGHFISEILIFLLKLLLQKPSYISDK